jgi:hypothetical protein
MSTSDVARAAQLLLNASTRAVALGVRANSLGDHEFKRQHVQHALIEHANARTALAAREVVR